MVRSTHPATASQVFFRAAIWQRPLLPIRGRAQLANKDGRQCLGSKQLPRAQGATHGGTRKAHVQTHGESESLQGVTSLLLLLDEYPPFPSPTSHTAPLEEKRAQLRSEIALNCSKNVW